MKKCIAILLVVATMILCLTACGGKKATAVVTFDDIKSGTVVAIPNQRDLSAGLQYNVLTVNVQKEGVFPFILLLDENEYSFILTYANGQFTAEADEGLSFTISKS